MQKIHTKLTQKYPKYHDWHQTKHHNTIHWGVFVVFTLLIFGTISRWTPISLAADTTAPTIPANLTAAVVSSTQINLSWSTSTDDVGVVGYKIYRCAGSACAPTVQISTSATNSYSDIGLTASTAYTYAVSAYDAAGNEGGKPASVSATTQAQTGNTYYVDQNNSAASDANPGTEALPWLTITKAANTVVAGDTVIVKAGRYIDPNGKWDSGAFNPVNSGTPSNPIIFKSEPPLSAIVVPKVKGVGPAMSIYGRSYIVMDGFKSEGMLGIYHSDHVTIQNCEVIYGSIQSIDPGLNWGIVVQNSSYNIVKNNYVHDMLNSGDSGANTAGIEVLGTSTTASNYNIIENNLSDPGKGNVYSAFGQKGGNIAFNIWRRNIATNATTGFLGMGSTDYTMFSTDNTYYDNIIINTTNAFELKNNSLRFQIYNNTANNVSKFFVSHETTDKDNLLWNNISVGNNMALWYGGYPEGSAFSNTISYSDHNNFYKFPVIGYREKTPTLIYNTIKIWQDATGFDKNSMVSDPMFVNADSGDFHLQGTSPARNVGIDRQDYDNDGDTTERINMGAYITGNEQIGHDWTLSDSPLDTTPPTTPANLTATVISSSQINLSWTASTDDTGVTGYKIYRCAGSGCTPTAQIATSAANSYSDTGLTASTAYTYAVSAYDAAGNESGKSGAMSVTTLSQFKPSDLNQDRKVDQQDFDILKQDWNRTDKPVSDINQDGVVDSRDLGIMMSEWTR